MQTDIAQVQIQMSRQSHHGGRLPDNTGTSIR
jgi:hypothetical protein